MRCWWLTILLCVLVSQLSVAQQHNSLDIDASSFAPIQTGVLSGVAIDKILPDNSKRPCARIKLRVNRMTLDEIKELSVVPIGGNVEVTKTVVASERNGLIIELTAKEQTRFYLHHERYGDSNEVTLNLEGDKEYRLSAQLSLLQSIVVSTNVADADVYIDDIYRGKTDEKCKITVEGITHGIHKIRIEHGSVKKEEDIEITSKNIFFEIEVPITESEYSTKSPIGEHIVQNTEITEPKTIGDVSLNSTSRVCKNIKVRYPVNGASVYIDGKYVGLTNQEIAVSHGVHNLVVGVHGYRSVYWGKKIEVDADSPYSISMNDAISVSSRHSECEFPASKKSNISSSKQRISWDSFNLGLFADVTVLPFDKYGVGVGTGVLWRMFRHDSLIIPTIALGYMYGFGGSHIVSLPITINYNIAKHIPGINTTCYFGAGVEFSYLNYSYKETSYKDGSIFQPIDTYYNVNRWDYPVVLSMGWGKRHHDIQLYSKFSFSESSYWCIGCRYAYLF